MRWCGCKIWDHGAANRIFLQDPWRSRPWVHSRFSTNFRQRFPQSFRDDSPWERFQLITPISSRVRITLIVYFQLIMKICYRNWSLNVSAAPAKRWTAEKILLIILSSWCLSGPAQAGPQRTIPFFCWDRVAFFGRTGGREYSNSRNADKRKCRQIA